MCLFFLLFSKTKITWCLGTNISFDSECHIRNIVLIQFFQVGEHSKVTMYGQIQWVHNEDRLKRVYRSKEPYVAPKWPTAKEFFHTSPNATWTPLPQLNNVVTHTKGDFARFFSRSRNPFDNPQAKYAYNTKEDMNFKCPGVYPNAVNWYTFKKQCIKKMFSNLFKAIFFKCFSYFFKKYEL